MALDEVDYKVLSEMEKGIPPTTEPFSDIANRIGIAPKEVISRLTKLQENGVIRRFGASIMPYNIGLSANALIVWKVPESRVQEVGTFFSKIKEITHCYQRKTVPLKWEYTLYTVMHAQERQAIEQLVKKLSEATAISDYIILFSKRELKKTSVTTKQSFVKSSTNIQELKKL